MYNRFGNYKTIVDSESGVKYMLKRKTNEIESYMDIRTGKIYSQGKVVGDMSKYW